MFNDVLSQDAAKSAVTRVLHLQRVPFGLLFYGPPAVGKFTMAKALAKGLNCKLEGKSGCVCTSCKKVEHQVHPDVKFIAPNDRDTIVVEPIRSLVRTFGFKLNEGKRKVCVIRACHEMTAQANNALLKVLEEPPGDATLILTTNAIEKVPSTIRSRCQLVRFGYLPDAALFSLLQRDKQDSSEVSIALLSGSYRPSALPTELNMLRELWKGAAYEADSIKLDAESLVKEVQYMATSLSYMMRQNLHKFREFEFVRLPLTKVATLVQRLDRALYMLDRGVPPFLVLRWMENRVREVLFDNA